MGTPLPANNPEVGLAHTSVSDSESSRPELLDSSSFSWLAHLPRYLQKCERTPNRASGDGSPGLPPLLGHNPLVGPMLVRLRVYYGSRNSHKLPQRVAQRVGCRTMRSDSELRSAQTTLGLRPERLPLLSKVETKQTLIQLNPKHCARHRVQCDKTPSRALLKSKGSAHVRVDIVKKNMMLSRRFWGSSFPARQSAVHANPVLF